MFQILKLLILTVSLVLSSISYAGQVAYGDIIEIVNIAGTRDEFGIRMSVDSTGDCTGPDKWIFFKKDNFTDNNESYKFAFSIATAALMANKKVRVHNYTDNQCDGVTFIGVFSN
jgi:hypothetical protein